MSEPTRESAPRRNDAARSSVATDLSLIAVFAALIAALAIMPAMTLGRHCRSLHLPDPRYLHHRPGTRAASAPPPPWHCTCWLASPACPSSAKGGAGLGSLASPSAGYLLGFLPFAAIAGTLAYLFTRNTRSVGATFLMALLANFCGFVVLTACGIAGMMVNAHMSFIGRVQRGNGIRPLGSGEVRHRGSGRFVGAPRLPVPDFHPALETPPNYPRGSYVFPPLPAPEYTADRAGRAGG